MVVTDLVEICHRVGARIPHWTQGKGGNISVKEADHLWIKASGARLHDVSMSRGIACVDLKRFESLRRTRPGEAEAEAWYARALTECATAGARPSMETGFHALLPARWVVHFHSLASMVLAHEYQRGPELVTDFLHGHGRSTVTFVPAEIPGWNLSLRLLDRADGDAFVLANHGVVLQGSDPGSMVEEWERVERAFCREWGVGQLVDFGARLARDELAGRAFRAYFPDAVVFRDGIVACSREGTASVPAARDGIDALEMLEAMTLLEKTCPELAELDPTQCAAIATLPTETFRRA